MFCPKCGKKNDEGAKFCEECGALITSDRVIGNVNRVPSILSLRHPKESFYFLIAAIAGGIVWLALIWLVILFIWVAIPVAIGLWIAEQFFKSWYLGNSVKLSKEQYPEIFEIVEKHSRIFNLNKHPDVFIVNSEGKTNALAAKFLKTKYILLYSSLIDRMLSHNSLAELSSIIGHELGHHIAGHTAIWKNLLLKPAMFVPFLGPAYFRACELTADRIGAFLAGDKDAASLALMTLACGSSFLAPKINAEAFKNQEKQLSSFFAFLNDLWATHPRITKRVLSLEEFRL
ncbi:MAG: M48 family metalloprotease [Candidatus Omnitrophica bacterium]|nr:M48 family metalloprotease [Candidatus Omnitrophota bacterium]